MGARGALLLDGGCGAAHRAGRASRRSTPPARATPFVGSFARYYVGGDGLEAALDKAVRYAADSITRRGTQKAYATEAEFEAFCEAAADASARWSRRRARTPNRECACLMRQGARGAYPWTTAARRPSPAIMSSATRARRSTPPGSKASAVNLSAVERRTATLAARRSVKKEYQAAWLVKALTCIDLTTLAGDDTPGRVRRLCAKARRPLSDELLDALDLADDPPTVAAVCVYPTDGRAGRQGARRLRHSGRLGRDRLSGRPDAAEAAARRDRLRRRAKARARSTSSSPAPMC